jgi:FkbM family methyltransferase
MKSLFKNLLNVPLKPFDLGITRRSAIEKLLADCAIGAKAKADLDFLQAISGEHAESLVNLLHKSKSQFRQDLFVLSQLDFRHGGYFVEFGATNGVDLSNTYLMEKEFGWTGILAEPAVCWHPQLRLNRNAHIDSQCVWSDSSSTLTFNESPIPDLSTISEFSDADLHGRLRKGGKSYQVQSISLNDLLRKYDAPEQIDYLSIDTEGSEFEILDHFDFSRHTFKVITCEHNFTPMRERLFGLLAAHGYTRVHQQLSGVDDWYVGQDGLIAAV